MRTDLSLLLQSFFNHIFKLRMKKMKKEEDRRMTHEPQRTNESKVNIKLNKYQKWMDSCFSEVY